MTFFRLIVLSMVWGALLLSAKEVVPFKLPPGTVVTSEDERGDTWRQNCELAGNITFVRKQLVQCLTHANWLLEKTILLGGKDKRALMQWRKGNRTLLLMVWSVDSEKTGFSWGI